MLIVTGAVGQTKRIANLGEAIEITVLGISGDRVQLGVTTVPKPDGWSVGWPQPPVPSTEGEPEYLDIPIFLRKRAD